MSGLAEFFDMGIKWLEPFRIDPRIVADAAWQIDAHQSQTVDRVIDHFDCGAGVLQRYCSAGPEAAGIFLLRAGHFLVPHQRVVAAFGERHV